MENNITQLYQNLAKEEEMTIRDVLSEHLYGGSAHPDRR